MSNNPTTPVDELPWITGLRCPACNSSTLFVANGGYITCSLSTCPNSDYADALKADSQARERAAEERGRDNIIKELVQGWSGLADDIRTIQQGASSLERKSAALATRLSVLQPKRQVGDGGEG